MDLFHGWWILFVWTPIWSVYLKCICHSLGILENKGNLRFMHLSDWDSCRDSCLKGGKHRKHVLLLCWCTKPLFVAFVRQLELRLHNLCDVMGLLRFINGKFNGGNVWIFTSFHFFCKWKFDNLQVQKQDSSNKKHMSTSTNVEPY